MNEVSKKILLKVNAKSIAMSQVLRIKELLKEYGGKDHFHLLFCDGEKVVGKVEVESAFGVNYSPELKKELEVLGTVDLISE